MGEPNAKFELEFYKRCRRAGLGDTVKTESEIREAAEIVQKMATEKEFQRKLKRYHLKARWLNKCLLNGSHLFVAEEAKAEQKRKAEEVRQKAEDERMRIFEALPLKSWTHNSTTFILEPSCIRINNKTYLISTLTEITISHVGPGDYMVCIHGKGFIDFIHGTGQIVAIYKYLVKYSAMPEKIKSELLFNPYDLVKRSKEYQDRSRPRRTGSAYAYPISSKGKDASVIGRAVAGTIIAGPVGGVIGALSAVDKNNRNRGK